MENFSYPTLEPFNFMGLDNQTYETARVVVFPVPYSSTTYWKSGTKEGPGALIDASRHIELYDIETKKDASKQGIFTLPFLEPSKNSPQETIARIKTVMDKLLQDNKLPIMLGGEHSITLGAVQSFRGRSLDFSVLQIDAHPDLRDEFEGTKYHHGCVMRRVKDLDISLTQVGLRSFSEEDAQYLAGEYLTEQTRKSFLAPDLPITEIIATLKENVYLTFDLDALDSSIMPATGTPEPGGLNWHQVLNLLKEVAEKRKIIGVDMVELDPIPGLSAPDFLAAKLVYKIINYIT